MMAEKKSKAKVSTKKKKPSKKRRILVFFLKLGLVLGVLLSAFIFAVYLGIFGRIPEKDALSRIRNNSATLVYSHDDKLIGKYFLQNRMTIDQENVSQHVKNALVATEDSRFFKHKGLDFVSLGRVFVRTILMGNRSQGGGSTISQQLARNLYPRLDFGKFTMPINKVREIFISSRLEKVYSKEEILALYLNTVPFSENLYGIEVASQQFFGKPSLSLNPSEAACLVGMLAANTAYNPRVNPERSTKRRNIVLSRMEDQKFLSKDEAEFLKAQPIRLKYSKLDYNNGPAPYFMEYIRPKVQAILEENYPKEYNIYTDGLRVITCLDSTLQEYANQAVDVHMKQLQKEFEAHWSSRNPWDGGGDILWTAISSSPRYKGLVASGKNSKEAVELMRKSVETNVFDWESGKGKLKAISPLDSIKQNLKMLQTGFLALNPLDGHILAWVGGRNFEYFKYDHVTSRRQVGSTFKPILYSAVLTSGIDPCEYISNEVRVYPDFQDWAPENSDGEHEGYYSVKGALANSVNTVSAALIDEIGISTVIDQARLMGISSDIPEVPSIALGSVDLSVYEMISAYSTFARLGQPVDPVSVLRIEDWKGEVLWTAPEAEPMDSALDYGTSRVMAEMMKGVVERGTGRSLRWKYGLTSEIAGKTGTTQDNADGWFIGYNPGIVAGAWVGADNPGVHFRTTALGGGSHTGLPIFARFMQEIEKDGDFQSISSAQFPELSDSLADRLACQDFVLDDPNITIIEKIRDVFARPDSVKEKRIKKSDVRKQEEDKKEGFFKRLGKKLKRKK